MSKLVLTVGEDAIFRAMVSEPMLRIQEDSLGGDRLRYGLVVCRSVKPVLTKILENNDVFGLMALNLLEFEIDTATIQNDESKTVLYKSAIYKLSNMARMLKVSETGQTGQGKSING